LLEKHDAPAKDRALLDWFGGLCLLCGALLFFSLLLAFGVGWPVCGPIAACSTFQIFKCNLLEDSNVMNRFTAGTEKSGRGRCG
jgi:hypothetical protein